MNRDSVDIHQHAHRIVRNYTLTGLGIGVIPLPWVDMAALTGLQLKMLHSLAKLYGIPFDEHAGKSAVSALLGAYVPLSLSGTAKLIPGLGHALVFTLQAPACAATTYAVGKVFTQHFAAGGTFLDFDPDQVAAYFAEQASHASADRDGLVSTPENPGKP